MKKMTFLFSLLAVFFAMLSCETSSSEEVGQKAVVGETILVDTNDAVSADSATFYSEVIDPKNCFILVSKPELRLYVCEVVDNDTIKRMHYPVCVGLKKGQKQKKGDMKTPECTAANPFVITEIKWYHDFGDSRGSILAYGNWFMRLKTPGHSGIGIHGGTNNESSVPGRGSEGCIRLRNNDLDDLTENYAFVGMRVVVLADEVEEGE